MSLFSYLIETSKKVFVSKKISRCILIAIVPALLFYSFSLFGFRSQGFEIMEILRDPSQQSGESSFIGFLSNIGIWLWVSSAAICFFSITTSNSLLKKNHKELLFLTGMMSIILAFDDFFLIHDRYIKQTICYLFYAILASTILLRHNKLLLEIEGFAFLLAGSLLALSIFTDTFQYYISQEYYGHIQIVEEGFKFTGAAAWLYFNSRIASHR